MTDLRKAAEMALEALEDIFGKEKQDVGAINALRQAIEQAEKQEPYGYLWFTHHMERRFTHYKPKEEQRIGDVRPVYATPVDAVNISQERVDETAKGGHEKKEWVGLTDEERQQIVYTYMRDPFDCLHMIEAKLKEKNGG